MTRNTVFVGLPSSELTLIRASSNIRLILNILHKPLPTRFITYELRCVSWNQYVLEFDANDKRRALRCVISAPLFRMRHQSSIICVHRDVSME